MNAGEFNQQDRQMFERAARLFGGPALEAIKARLGEGVWGNDGSGTENPLARLLGETAEARIREAGRKELMLVLPFLDRRTRRRVLQSPWCRGPAPASGPEETLRSSRPALRSLGATLFWPTEDGTDLVLRAGVHRLARALADLGPGAAREVAERLTPSLARHLVAAWTRLAAAERTRPEAARLRSCLGPGENG